MYASTAIQYGCLPCVADRRRRGRKIKRLFSATPRSATRFRVNGQYDIMEKVYILFKPPRNAVDLLLYEHGLRSFRQVCTTCVTTNPIRPINEWEKEWNQKCFEIQTSITRFYGRCLYDDWETNSSRSYRAILKTLAVHRSTSDRIQIVLLLPMTFLHDIHSLNGRQFKVRT